MISPEEHLGLARLCAQRFVGKGVEYDDLYQAGCVGLVKAAAGFDESRGLQFSTYAVPVILGEIRRLFREGQAVRVSRGMRELGRRARELQEEAGRERGCAMSLEELAGRLECSPQKAALALGSASPTVSLTDDESGEQLDLPMDGPEESLTERMSLRQLLMSLEERDRRLIALRYFQGMTQARVGEQLGMSQVQVSRREKKLLQQMKAALME